MFYFSKPLTGAVNLRLRATHISLLLNEFSNYNIHFSESSIQVSGNGKKA